MVAAVGPGQRAQGRHVDTQLLMLGDNPEAPLPGNVPLAAPDAQLGQQRLAGRAHASLLRRSDRPAFCAWSVASQPWA